MFKHMSFDKEVELFGDSKLINESSLIQLTNSVTGSEGRVVYNEPINLSQGEESSNSLSFSSYFSFSMPNETDDVMAFVMVPTSMDLSLFGKKHNNPSALGFLLEHAKNETVVAFEFDISSRGNHARILIGKPESSEVRDLSFDGDLLMDNGGTLSCMIDYEEHLKRMMVRFRKLGTRKMVDPFFEFSVDLEELWNGGEFMVGLSSTNGNSSEAHVLHSWNFDIRHPPPMCVTPVLPQPCEEGPDGSVSM